MVASCSKHAAEILAASRRAQTMLRSCSENTGASIARRLSRALSHRRMAKHTEELWLCNDPLPNPACATCTNPLVPRSPGPAPPPPAKPHRTGDAFANGRGCTPNPPLLNSAGLLYGASYTIKNTTHRSPFRTHDASLVFAIGGGGGLRLPNPSFKPRKLAFKSIPPLKRNVSSTERFWNLSKTIVQAWSRFLPLLNRANWFEGASCHEEQNPSQPVQNP